MAHLIYIHGFLSSPKSIKAIQVRDWLKKNRPDINYHCPFLTPYFDESVEKLESLVGDLQAEPVYLIGSSLGGYLATFLGEKYNLRAVLLNPLVNPREFRDKILGVELKNFHTDDRYYLNETHADILKSLDIPEIKRKENYWLLVQTGDEILDYRLAVKKYKECKQLIEEGGDHSFTNFIQHVPKLVEFLVK